MLNPRVLSLALAPFAFGTSAFVFVGLLEPMAESLEVSVPVAAQLQTAFAIASAVGGPVCARLTASLDRKRVLSTVLAVLVAMNAASALAPGFSSLIALRIVGGFIAAMTLPVASTIAVGTVPPERRAGVIAMVLAGYTLAFLLGMPLGSVLGDVYGWRASFWFAAGLSALAFGVIGIFAPTGAGTSAGPGGSFRAALRGDNTMMLALTFLTFVATFTTVAFIGPVITRTTGLQGAAVGAVQSAVGVGSLLGLPLGARMARWPVRSSLTLLIAGVAVAQLLFWVGLSVSLGQAAIPVQVLTIMIGSASLFATSPVIQVRLAESAGPAATLAFALNGTMIFLAQGAGAALGGAVVSQLSFPSIGIAGAIVAILALVVSRRLQPAPVPGPS